MTTCFIAELLKLRRRPACWVLLALLLGAIVLLLYALPYALVTYSSHSLHPAQVVDIKHEALPANLVSTLLPFLGGLGRGIAVVLAALMVGSEYSWGTFKTILIQRPGRLTVFGGKIIALGAVLAVFVLLSFATALAASAVVASLMHGSIGAPPLLDLAKAMASVWLIFATSAAFAAVLVVLFRGPALAIALVLIEALFLENIITGLFGHIPSLSAIPSALPGQNANALTDSFASSVVGQLSPLVSAGHAALVLAAYTAGFILLAGILFRTRDVA